MKEELVLDSWLVVAWLKDQHPAADRMAKLWERAGRGEIRLLMSMISLGEILYLTGRKKGWSAAGELLAHLRTRPLELLSVSDGVVLEASRLKASYLISYADAFAVATAWQAGCPVATGDPELRPMEAAGILALEWAT